MKVDAAVHADTIPEPKTDILSLAGCQEQEGNLEDSTGKS